MPNILSFIIAIMYRKKVAYVGFGTVFSGVDWRAVERTLKDKGATILCNISNVVCDSTQ